MVSNKVCPFKLYVIMIKVLENYMVSLKIDCTVHRRNYEDKYGKKIHEWPCPY